VPCSPWLRCCSLGERDAERAVARPATEVQPPPPERDGPLTAQTLLADGNDRYWPRKLKLVDAWRPPGADEPLRAGTRGVLIRVEPGGKARVDFGRSGRHAVPVEATNLVELANQLRAGEIQKRFPNFMMAIGPRLVSSEAPQLRPLRPRDVVGASGYLCVFADPDDERFAELAAALAPLDERHGVKTVLFPQGSRTDPEVRERLRALGWTVPFVYDRLSEPYTRTLRDEDAPLPALMLQTPDGRVVFEGAWSPEVTPSLALALDEAFGSATVAGASDSRSEAGPSVPRSVISSSSQ
jgi:hypothetical protein